MKPEDYDGLVVKWLYQLHEGVVFTQRSLYTGALHIVRDEEKAVKFEVKRDGTKGWLMVIIPPEPGCHFWLSGDARVKHIGGLQGKAMQCGGHKILSHLTYTGPDIRAPFKVLNSVR